MSQPSGTTAIGLAGHPCGMWTTTEKPANRFEVDDARLTLRIAAELGRTRVLAGGLWWTWQPIPLHSRLALPKK